VGRWIAASSAGQASTGFGVIEDVLLAAPMAYATSRSGCGLAAMTDFYAAAIVADIMDGTTAVAADALRQVSVSAGSPNLRT
jgi:hypothetical protein